MSSCNNQCPFDSDFTTDSNGSENHIQQIEEEAKEELIILYMFHMTRFMDIFYTYFNTKEILSMRLINKTFKYNAEEYLKKHKKLKIQFKSDDKLDTQSSLCNLKFGRVTFREHTIRPILYESILKHVTQLYLYNCNFSIMENYDDILKFCPKITSLTVILNRHMGNLYRRFPSVKYGRILVDHMDMEAEELATSETNKEEQEVEEPTNQEVPVILEESLMGHLELYWVSTFLPQVIVILKQCVKAAMCSKDLGSKRFFMRATDLWKEILMKVFHGRNQP